MKTDQGSLSGTQSIEIYSVNDKLPRWGQCVVVVTPYYTVAASLALAANGVAPVTEV